MQRLDLDHPRYTLVAWGSLPPDRVVLDYDPRRRPRLSPERARQILADADRIRAEGRVVEAHPLYRYLGCTCSPRMLLLKLGHCDYEQYLGLNRLHREWGEAEGPDLRADAVGLAVVCDSPDGAILEERSRLVAEAPGALHVKPSGHAHPPGSFTAAVLDEAREELGLGPEEVQDLACLGLVRVRDCEKMVLIYSARTSVTLAEMEERTRGETWEAQRLLAAPLDAEGLADFLREQGESLAASGHAALVMEGWRRHGNDWLARVWRAAGA